MAEPFLFNIAERALEKIALLAVEEVRLAVNVESEIRKLQETMISIKAVLLDAERKQHLNERIRLCVWKLRDLFYDAEDVLDEFHCVALPEEAGNHLSDTIKKVPCLASCFKFPLPFSVAMGHKIKKINRGIDKIATAWERFNLGKGDDDRQVICRETHSSVISSNVVGRKVDRENIINLLKKPSEGQNSSVIPIVGVGGLGKTTLTQFVYNDERVNRLFTFKIWVCVSDDFELAALLKKIILSISGESCGDLTVEALKIRLRSLLNNNNYLLVLDDVWNENRVTWTEFRDLLMSLSNLSQSKIIVTTRSFKVASIMSSIHPYELEGLSHVDCLKLFTKWEFNDGEERQYPNLVKIGNEIVKKCKGVPLAVRTLGSLLFGKTEEQDWLHIKDNEIWRLEQSKDDILPVLKLSYHHLPSHLQRYLAYLSLYKKDYEYLQDEIIDFWMANGLLECPRQNEEWEDVGRRYLSELWARCFIQDNEHHGIHSIFKVHDLIHDLASDVSQKECKSVDRLPESIDEKIRHLSFYDVQLPNFIQNLKISKHVRTIILQELPFDSRAWFIDDSFINFCASKFKYLRSLDVTNSSLVVLPDSIGTLKQLRFLRLDYCRNLQELPHCLNKLQSLLRLGLQVTSLQQIPDSILSLNKLRRLDITVEATELKAIQVGCWSSLQYLCLFDCSNIQCLFEGMQYLTSLRTLYLTKCRSLVSLPRSLKLLSKLERLQITKCNSLDLHMEQDEDIHLNLKTFAIYAMREWTGLPRWLKGSASTLQYIHIENCDSFNTITEWLQNCTSLQKLEIFGCPISSLPEEMMDRLTALQVYIK